MEALPDGALKRQLLPELARQAQLASDDLVVAVGRCRRAGTRGPRRAAAAAGTSAAPARSGGRRAPAGPADLALRLLLRHSDWWERLSGDDHDLLHDLGGRAWRRRGLARTADHRTRPADLGGARRGAAGRDACATRRSSWVGSGTLDEEHSFDDLQRVMHRLWREHFEQEARALTAEGRTDREHLDRLRACHERIKQHRTAEITPPRLTPCGRQRGIIQGLPQRQE